MAEAWGRRTFEAGAVVLVLLGLVHSLAVASKPFPQNDTERQLLDLMSNYRFPLPGAVRSMADIHEGLGFAFSLMSLALGAVNLAVAGQSAAVLKRLAVVNVIWLAAMTVVSLRYWFAFPTAFLATSLVLFAASWIKLPDPATSRSGG